MREFKFRAWDKEKMIVVGCLQFFSNGRGDKSIHVNEEFIDLEIMQYTGLKDKNGKDIYEGDIVDFSVFDCFGNDTQYVACVVFAETSYMLWKKPTHEYFGSDGGWDLDWIYHQDEEIEVIGNIYKHPKLLEH